MLIAHISDPHVRPAGQLYQGVADSNRMFENAIDHLHALDRRPDQVTCEQHQVTWSTCALPISSSTRSPGAAHR